MSGMLARGILVLLASPLLITCAGDGSWGSRPHCPVVPVSTTDHLGDVELRARMHFSMDDREAHFEVVARRVPEELVLVGIAQHGTRLFAVHQRDREIAVEGAASRESTHLARWTLDALHRAIWITAPSDPEAAGVVDWNWENESVTEAIDGGRRTRRFARPDAAAPVVIRYGRPATESGDRVEIENPWCGYEATFVVFDATEQVAR
jgi:hypothetical protein